MQLNKQIFFLASTYHPEGESHQAPLLIKETRNERTTGTTERTAARGGAVHRRAGDDYRRCRQWQDTHADLPHSTPDREGRGPLPHIGADLHQQGRRRDEGAYHKTGRLGGPQYMDGHLPLGVRTRAARRRRQVGLHQQLHHLRHRRPEGGHQADSEATEPRPQGLQTQLCAGAHIHGQEQPDRAQGLHGEPRDIPDRPRRQTPRRGADIPDVRPAPAQLERHGLRRPAVQHEHTAARLPRRAAEIPAALQLHHGGRVPGHQLRAVPHRQEIGGTPPEHLRGGRRRAEHLRLPRGQHTEHLQL